MRPLRDRPIRQKVALIIAAASAMGLVFAGIAVVVYELTTFRPRVLQDARTQADIIRLNSIASLQFNDSQAANENLATLANRSEVLSARIWLPDGRLFAAYLRPGAPAAVTSAPRLVRGERFLPNRLLVVDAMEMDGQLLGWLTLQFEVPPLWRRLPEYRMWRCGNGRQIECLSRAPPKTPLPPMALPRFLANSNRIRRRTRRTR